MAIPKKEQIIIDLRAREIKGTTKSLKNQLEEIIANNDSLNDIFNLKTFKVVKSLTADKDKVKGRFEKITYKSTKKDIEEYLNTYVKDEDKETYNEFMTLLYAYDFIVITKKFNEEIIGTDDTDEEVQTRKTNLNNIIAKNKAIKDAEDAKRKELQALRLANREKLKKEKEEKKASK